MFKQITILGSGLLGASLAMAIHKGKVAKRIKVWARRKETLKDCASKAWCHTVEENIEKSVQGSDLVIICTPVDTIVEIIRKIGPHLEEESIVTDVGSVKNEICKDGIKALIDSKGYFIGSHPMAGSEKSGMEYAHEDLIKGKSCIITPFKETKLEFVQRLADFWKALHMDVHQFSPDEHDKAAAYFSHLPHLLASSLSRHLESQPSNWKQISGNGLRDTTRIAEGDPQLWVQILQMNKDKLLSALEDWETSLSEVKKIIKNDNRDDLYEFLTKGSNFRKELDK